MHPSKLWCHSTNKWKGSISKKQPFIICFDRQPQITHMFSSIIKFPLIEIKKVGEEGNKIKRNEEKFVAW